MTSQQETSAGRRKLWKLIVQGFSFFASIIAVFGILGVTAMSAMIVLLVLLVLVIIFLLDERSQLRKEVWKRIREQSGPASKSTVSHPPQKQVVTPTAAKPRTKQKKTVIHQPTENEKALPSRIVLKKKFAVGYEEYKEYDLELLKNAKVWVQMESTQPVDFYFIDKWHFDRPEQWGNTRWKDTSIYEFDDTFHIGKAGKWFIVCEALDEPADISLTATIIDWGEEEKEEKFKFFQPYKK